MDSVLELNTDQMLWFSDALRDYPEMAAKRMFRAFKTSLQELKEETINAVPISEKPAITNEGRRFSRDTHKPGTLMRAIDSDYGREGPLTGRVYVNPESAPYGIHVVRGHGPFVVEPRLKTWLRWVDPDTNRFAFSQGPVVIPRASPNPFHTRALNAHKPQHIKLMNEAIHQSNRDATGRYLRRKHREFNGGKS